MNKRILTLKAIQKEGNGKKTRKGNPLFSFLWRLYDPSLTQQLERALGESEKKWQKNNAAFIHHVKETEFFHDTRCSCL